jgi:Domain of unknown function (DUF4112)
MPKPAPTPSNRPTETQLAQLRQLSHLWDQAIGIPGTKWRVGLESIIGLLPIGGDWIGLVMSSYILFHAVKFDLPRSVMLRMVFNIAIDAIVGAVPILGDLFDTTWKANTKNVNLLEAHLKSPLKSPQKSQSADKLVLWLLFIGCILFVVLLFGISVTLIMAIGKLIGQL